MCSPVIETATKEDFSELWRLECASFEPARRSSRRSLRRSLVSRHQLVRFVRGAPCKLVLASSILKKHVHSWRILSMAVAQEVQGRGLGKALVSDAIVQATAAGAGWLNLEVDALDEVLVSWYESQGFSTVQCLDDYYSFGRPALRMRRPLASAADGLAPGTG